jgi:hypothetical protein
MAGDWINSLTYMTFGTTNAVIIDPKEPAL